MKVKLKHASSKYRDLTAGNVYRVIGIEADEYRLMNDDGRPFLYPPRLFMLVDPAEPEQWKNWLGEDGERYAYPEELAKPGFFEDYFDGDRKALATLHGYLASQHETRGRWGNRQRMAG
jgi:hypothetical protein